MKKWLKTLLCIVLALVVLAAGYVAYVFIDYHRIGDMPLTPVNTETATPSLRTGTPYTAVSYNIGFGAYEDDYGFFMDGGTESRAWSEERLTANLDGDRRFAAEAQDGRLLSGAGGGHGLHPHLSGGRASLYHRRRCPDLSSVYCPELRLPLPAVSPYPDPTARPRWPAC